MLRSCSICACCAGAVMAAGLLFVSANAVAAPRTWDANGAIPQNGTFSVAANWNPDVVPVAGDAVTFGSGGGPYTVTFSANAASDSATISVGTVNWRSDSATPRTFNLTSGAADLIVRDSSGALNVGATGNPMVVNVGDTVVSGGVGGIGQFNAMTLAGLGTSLTTGTLQLGDFDVKSGFLTVRENAILTVSGATTFAPGTLTIDGGQATLGTLNTVGGGISFVAGSLSYVGDLTVGAGGLLGSNLTLNANRNLALTGTTTVAAANTLTVGGGTLSTGALTGSGTLNFTAGTLSITGAGGLTIAAGSPVGSNVTLGTGRTLNVTNAMTINAGSLLMLDGGTLNTGSLVVNGDFVFNRGTLGFNQAGATMITPIVSLTPGATININANNVSIGSAGSLVGFHHEGTLTVGANAVTLHSAGYARLGVLTSLAGGSIFAPNGLALPSGSNLLGAGTIGARIAGELGSVIEATGSLAMGDSASPAGFNFAGELRTKQHTVTLVSTAAAGLGNLTMLGSGGSPGTLNAANGFVVDFDEAVTGYGTINSTNTPAKRATINGTVEGNSGALPITLSGYIKGVGTFNNVSFTGTYSPGLSPALTMVGSIIFGASNTLIMELGGTTRGDEYDAILASGHLGLGGTLDVDLINGFVPQAGDEFDLFDWATLSGAFSTFQFPTLAGGLVWDTSELYTTGVLSVGVAGDYNDDGKVDAADYVVWRKFNGTATTLPNDPNGVPIDGDQYNTWRANFGEPGGPGAGGSEILEGAVPEPVSFVLLLGGLLSAFAIRHGRCLG